MFDLSQVFTNRARVAAYSKSGRAERTELRDDDLVDAEEISRITAMSRRWVYDRFAVEVPPMRIGNKSRWYHWQVKAYLAEKQREVAAR